MAGMDARNAESRPWPVRRRFVVPYHDVDAMNHLNHAAYFPMMETLRCDYYLPLIGSRDPTDLDIIVAEAACRYLAPARYADVLLGELAPLAPLGRTSFSLAYRFVDERSGRTVARGRTVLVTYDYTTGTKRPIPDDRRRRLETDALSAGADGWGP